MLVADKLPFGRATICHPETQQLSRSAFTRLLSQAKSHYASGMTPQAIFKLVISYAAVAGLYIVFSDSLLLSAGMDAATLARMSTFKGLGFVVVTAGTLWLLLQRLRNQEQGRYRALLDNHHAVMLVLDPEDSRIVDVSLAAETYYGWSRQQLLGMYIWDLNILPRETLREEMERARRNDVAVFHFQHRLADGSIRDVDAHAGPIVLDGKPRLLSIIHDVTEQRRASLQLNRLNRLYNLLYRSARAMPRCSDPANVYREACELAVNTGDFSFAWIGLVSDGIARGPSAQAGKESGFLKAFQDNLGNASSSAHSMAQQAVDENRMIVHNDLAQSLGSRGEGSLARKAGFLAAATLPFQIGGQTAGTLNLYSGASGFFGEPELQTLSQLAEEISSALDNQIRQRALETSAEVINSSPVIVFRWRPDSAWTVEFVSPNVERWGYQPESLLSGQIPFEKLVHPEDLVRVTAEVKDYSASGTTSFSLSYRIVTASGETRWVDDRTQVVRDDRGEVIALQGTLADITETRLALTRLEESEQRFRRAIEEAPVPIMMHAEDGRVLVLSDTWLELTGYSRDELSTVGAWSQRAYGAEQDQVMNVIRDLYDLPERSNEGEFRIRTKAGNILVWNFSSVSLGRNGDGKRIALSIASDITALKATESALQTSRSNYQRILENSPDVLFVNKNDRVAYINAAGVQLLGASRAEDLLDRPVFDLFLPESHERIRERIRNLRKQAESRAEASQETMVSLTGQRLPVTANAVSYRDGDDDSDLAILVTCRDIRSEIAAEQTIADYVSRLEDTVLGTAAALSQMVELRDPYTAGHERRVGELAAAIAAEMGFDDNFQRGLRLAGAVHDIGKIQVPAEILTRPTALTPTEFELVKAHAQAGYEVLRDIDFPWPIAEVAHQHHERIDGSGYPQGLKGDAILLEARIAAVADVVEAMSSHRPYRPALGIEKALAEVESGAGTRYDADAVRACLTLFRDKNYSIPD